MANKRLIKIKCEHVTKKFGSLLVLDDISLDVEENEFLVLLGPSGCGKSTFLSLLAGFEKPDKGKIYIDNVEVKNPSRKIGFVFQDYALFPWKTVLGNVMSGLWDKKNRKEIAISYIKKVGLFRFKDEYPHKLSGGMQQRVAIARALAYNPEILLMDEPFGALDAQTKKLMQQELKNLLQEFNKTIVFVTHSVIEAVYLADRIVIFSNRPARIVREMRIEIKGKRNYTSKEFLAYREKILSCLDKETGIKE